MNSIRTNCFFWGLVLLLLMLAGILFSPVSGDAPYYLSIARDISHGLVPYRDINVAYTPLTMYFNSLFWFFGHPDYCIFITFQYSIIVLSGFILYQLSLRMGLDKMKAIFLSIFFSICILSSDGHSINLEVYSILFVLLAYLALLQKKYVLSGFVLGLTFFCKQYGILNFVPFLLLLFFSEGRKVQPILKFCIGGIMPLIIFLWYFCILKDTTFEILLYQLTGQGYGEINIAAPKTLFGIVNGAKVFLLMLLPMFFYKFNLFNNTVRVALIIGIIMLLLPVSVQSFQHYFLNTFPYIAILMITIWQQNEIRWLPIHFSLVVVSVLLIARLANHTEKGIAQQRVARTLLKTYPKGTAIFLKGQANYLYILNDYSNPALKQVGYSYIFKTNPEFLRANVVLTFDPIRDQVPERIISASGTKIYEY